MGALAPPIHVWHPEIPRAERLVFALDVASRDEALEHVARLGDAVRFYKIGWELLMGGEYFALVDDLARMGKRVFADLKVVDIPETVERAVRNLKVHPGMCLTCFAQYPGVLEAAVRAKSGVCVCAVTTALTSKSRSDLVGWGDLPEERSVSDLVLQHAERAALAGCEGFVCSALEVAKVRASFGNRLQVFSPGIRPAGGQVANDDQKRTATPEEAFRNGSDYVIVGRPIRDAADPRAAALAIQETIAKLFPG